MIRQSIASMSKSSRKSSIIQYAPSPLPKTLAYRLARFTTFFGPILATGITVGSWQWISFRLNDYNVQGSFVDVAILYADMARVALLALALMGLSLGGFGFVRFGYRRLFFWSAASWVTLEILDQILRAGAEIVHQQSWARAFTLGSNAPGGLTALLLMNAYQLETRAVLPLVIILALKEIAAWKLERLLFLVFFGVGLTFGVNLIWESTSLTNMGWMGNSHGFELFYNISYIVGEWGRYLASLLLMLSAIIAIWNLGVGGRIVILAACIQSLSMLLNLSVNVTSEIRVYVGWNSLAPPIDLIELILESSQNFAWALQEANVPIVALFVFGLPLIAGTSQAEVSKHDPVDRCGTEATSRRSSSNP